MTAIYKIAVVYASPCMDSTPCLYHLVQSLIDCGHEVSAYLMDSANFPRPKFKGNADLNFFSGSRRKFAFWLNSMLRKTLADFDFAIAVDRLGLLALSLVMGLSRRACLIYFNVELYLPPIFNGYRHWIANRVEAWILRRRAALILSPSCERADYLAHWYNLDRRKFVVIPNAPAGTGEIVQSNYLRDLYNIAANYTVYLYFGSLTSANRIEELIKDARDHWPADAVLICHGPATAGDEERKRLQSMAEGAICRIYFSFEPVPADALKNLVASADAGIALYPEGISFETMGTASGKIGTYLSCGVPVVTSPHASLVTLSQDHPGAGTFVKRAADIPLAHKPNFSFQSPDRRAAVDCFNAHFSFDAGFQILLGQMELLHPGHAFS